MAGKRARSARDARRRALSQNFLRSRRLADELVRDAEIEPRDLVVEIGAGGGLLTDVLARRAQRVVAIEVDPALARALRDRWRNVDVVEADALTLPLPAEPFKVVANLPFHRTNDALRHLFDDPCVPLVRADLVIAWGAALKRSSVWPSTMLGAYWGAWYAFGTTRRLPAALFVPRPSVDAAVLAVTRRAQPLVPRAEWRSYRSFVSSGFRQGLRSLVPARRFGAIADALAFPRDAAPRDLDAHQWAALFEAVRPRAQRPRSVRRGG